jgi:hypothetical protein
MWQRCATETLRHRALLAIILQAQLLFQRIPRLSLEQAGDIIRAAGRSRLGATIEMPTEGLARPPWPISSAPT